MQSENTTTVDPAETMPAPPETAAMHPYDGVLMTVVQFQDAYDRGERDFTGARFPTFSKFYRARFDGASFDGARFVGARFDGARFVGASFDGARFVGARFDGARFDGARFDGASFDGASFDGASFDGASFDGARFVGARFDGARFVGARFDGARFDGARFDGASFDGARFVGARFDGARFVGASFDGARFVGASFDGARFVGASFDGASFDGASFDTIRDDVYRILDAVPAEVPALLEEFRAGRIDGSLYHGECACLVGTVAKLRGCDIHDIPGVTPRASSPAEAWVAAIRPGHTPANSPISEITVGWIEEWIAAHPAEIEPAAAVTS